MTYTWEPSGTCQDEQDSQDNQDEQDEGATRQQGCRLKQHECQWLLRPSEGAWLARGLRQWANPLTDKDNKLAKTVKDHG